MWTTPPQIKSTVIKLRSSAEIFDKFSWVRMLNDDVGIQQLRAEAFDVIRRLWPLTGVVQCAKEAAVKCGMVHSENSVTFNFQSVQNLDLAISDENTELK